jgi:hypothetical protein
MAALYASDGMLVDTTRPHADITESAASDSREPSKTLSEFGRRMQKAADNMLGAPGPIANDEISAPRLRKDLRARRFRHNIDRFLDTAASFRKRPQIAGRIQ